MSNTHSCAGPSPDPGPHSQPFTHQLSGASVTSAMEGQGLEI